MALRTAVGGRESNSFVTLKEGLAILATLPDSPDDSGFSDAETAQQELCLSLAAQAMDYLPWRGLRVFCGQALPFPRTCQDVRTVIPDEIKVCQVFIAHSVVWRALQARPEIADGGVSTSRVTSVSLGGMLSVSFSGDAAKAGTIMDRLTQSAQFPAYLMVNRYLSQVRGRMTPRDGEEYQCITTTTTTSTTTTTTSTTTTTT